MTTFSEILAEISQGEAVRPEEEERVNLEETPEEDGSNPVEEPESESQDGAPEEKPEGEEVSAEGEPAEAPKEEQPVTVEIDGEQVTLEQLREWRKSGLRLEDYTRKTQEVATLRRNAEERETEFVTLARDIAQDESLQAFLKARPEAIEHLMANPKGTRSLIGNPKKVEDFWTDYDLIRNNPRLAEKLAQRPEEGRRELAVENERQTMTNVVGALDNFIDVVAREAYPGLDPNPVKEYVASLAGVPANPSHEDQLRGVTKLFGLFFRQDENQQWNIDPRLIQGEFERMKATSHLAEDPEEKVAAEHNKKIDEQLKDSNAPPKTPGGKPPKVTEEAFKADSFQDVLEALRGN